MAQNAESFNQVPFSDLEKSRGESGTVYVVNNGLHKPSALPPRETWLGAAAVLVGRPPQGSHRPQDGLHVVTDGFENLDLPEAIAWANFSHRVLNEDRAATTDIAGVAEASYWLVADGLYYRRAAISRDKDYTWPDGVIVGGALAHTSNGVARVSIFHAVQFEALKLTPDHAAIGLPDVNMIERQAARIYNSGRPANPEYLGAIIPMTSILRRLSGVLRPLADPELVGQSAVPEYAAAAVSGDSIQSDTSDSDRRVVLPVAA